MIPVEAEIIMSASDASGDIIGERVTVPSIHAVLLWAVKSRSMRVNEGSRFSRCLIRVRCLSRAEATMMLVGPAWADVGGAGRESNFAMGDNRIGI